MLRQAAGCAAAATFVVALTLLPFFPARTIHWRARSRAPLGLAAVSACCTAHPHWKYFWFD